MTGPKKHVISLLENKGLNKSNISFYVAPFTMPYWRNFGPIFTVDAAGGKSIADFNFNCWGYFPDTDTQARMMERIDRDAAKAMGLPSRMTRLVSEAENHVFLVRDLAQNKSKYFADITQNARENQS